MLTPGESYHAGKGIKHCGCCGIRLVTAAVFLAVAPLFPAISQTTSSIPFPDGFELYPIFTPLVNGTNGWHSATLHNTETNVIVQRNVVRSQLQSAIIPFNSVLSNQFSVTNKIVWVQADVLPAFFDELDVSPEVNEGSSAEFFINSNGYFVVHNGVASPTPTNSINWITITNLPSGAQTDPVESNAWVRIHLHLDYNTKLWSLYADYQELRTNILFVNPAAAAFRGFGIYNGGEATNYSGIMTTYVDNVSVQASRIPPDLVPAPDVTTNQTFRGRNAPAQVFEVSSTTAEFWTLNCAVASQTNWIAPLPASFVLTNDSPQIITNRFLTSGLAAGVHTGAVWISTPDAWGTTQAMTVVMEVMEFATSPTQLTAVTQFGINPDSQEFNVWNAGGGLMEYTVTTNVPWMRVVPGSGASQGGATNNHTVSFNTGGLAVGVHTGHLILASSIGSGETQRVNVVITVVPFPELMVSPATIEVETQRGFNASNKTYEVWRSGDYCTLVYTSTVHATSPWMAVNPKSGTSLGEHDTITLSFDTASLPGGVYTGRVTVAGSVADFGLNAGGSPKVVTVVLRVRQLGDDVTQRIRATQGLHTDKVVVDWDAISGAASYEVWKHSTFDIGFAQKVAAVIGLQWEDSTVSPAVTYYYWVRPMSSLGYDGIFSSNAPGWSALSAPMEISASKGAYADRVRLEWSGAVNAESYDIWRQNGSRSDQPDPAKSSVIMHTTKTSYEDLQVLSGETYTYWVRSRKPDFVSDFSESDQGFVLRAPSPVSASDGTYLDKVRVSWSAVSGATSYEVWRADDDNVNVAALVGQVTALVAPGAAVMYDDASVETGKTYVYWLKSRNTSGATGFSGSDRGFSAIGNANIRISDVVFLPAVMGRGERPTVVSYRIRNQGPHAMASPDTLVLEEIYTIQTGVPAAAPIVLGSRQFSMALAAGQETGVILPQSVLPAMNVNTSGAFNVYVRVTHCPPSRLGDSNPEDNVGMRSEPVEVREAPGIPYLAINDFNGNGRSDLAVYGPLSGQWFVRCLTGELLVWGDSWGGASMTPSLGDFDGDGKADFVVYNAALGAWYGKSSAGNLLMWALPWGAPGMKPVWGDFDGDGRSDLAVYHEASGAWYILGMNGNLMAWAIAFGGPGFSAVPGDYDGDGKWDMTAYDRATGKWYSRNMNGDLILWAENWGGGAFIPVPGDYNADGKWDLAVYDPYSGNWFIRGRDGVLLAWAVSWGGAGLQPVSGDFNGDGNWDMAVYDTSIGLWFIRGVNGEVLAWGLGWGGHGLTPQPSLQ